MCVCESCNREGWGKTWRPTKEKYNLQENWMAHKSDTTEMVIE